MTLVSCEPWCFLSTSNHHATGVMDVLAAENVGSCDDYVQKLEAETKKASTTVKDV